MTQPSIFISYSHKDELEKETLLSQLKVLKHAGLVDVWSDDRIGAGSSWETDINQAMKQAKVAVLLISANFLTSDFILNTEVPRLLERRQREGVVVFPVIAKACAWQQVPWLAAMNVRPKNGTPVWRDGGKYADEELAKIADEIATIARQPDSTVSSSATSPINVSSSAQISKPASSEMSDVSAITTSKKIGQKNMNWEKIGAIAGVIAVIVAILAFAISSDLRSLIFPVATPTPVIEDFTYQARVEDKNTGENISGAKVTLEVGGKAPLDGITDSNGLARIFVSASHAGQPGRLIVEVVGYETYVQEIDVVQGMLPKVILLKTNS